MRIDKQDARTALWNLMGDLPPRDLPITWEIVEESQQDGYKLEKLVLGLNGSESVPAYFIKPAKSYEPLPAILYNHAHGRDYTIGKDELTLGRSGLCTPPYAKLLTAMGYAVLCIDAWAFGERRGRTESELFKHMLWHGKVMWGMMVYDSIRAIDYLTSRPDVDAGRIGTLGFSMGSAMAQWVAALDTRIKVCIDVCCLTDYQALINTNHLDGHGIYYYVPGLLNHFTSADINALIAPRPHLSIAGIYDPLTPPEGLDRIDEILKKTYSDENAPHAWRLIKYHTGHMETAAMRTEVTSFLRNWL